MATKKPVKKTTTSKSVKRATTTTTRSKKAPEMKSFQVYKDPKPFSRFQVTRQTVYWTILITVVVILQLWVLKVQLDVSQSMNTIMLSQ